MRLVNLQIFYLNEFDFLRGETSFFLLICSRQVVDWVYKLDKNALIVIIKSIVVYKIIVYRFGLS